MSVLERGFAERYNERTVYARLIDWADEFDKMQRQQGIVIITGGLLALIADNLRGLARELEVGQ
jgi:hypothetical protein